jgi:hypothetical protein
MSEKLTSEEVEILRYATEHPFFPTPDNALVIRCTLLELRGMLRRYDLTNVYGGYCISDMGREYLAKNEGSATSAEIPQE